MNKKMLGTISVVALTMGTAGCGTANVNDTTTASEMTEQCDDLELVQGTAYSGDEKEVWYCADGEDDDNDHHHVGGMFFYPYNGGYYNASTMKSKHKVDVSSYKPGMATTKVKATDYNKAAKVKLPAYKPTAGKSTVKSSSSSSQSSSKISSTSSSKGFGSSSSSSGG